MLISTKHLINTKKYLEVTPAINQSKIFMLTPKLELYMLQD